MKAVTKHSRRMPGVEEQAISLPAKGLTTGEISALFAEVWGADVSKDTISKIKDKVLAEMAESIAATWPLAIHRTCVLHLIGNTFRYASKAD